MQEIASPNANGIKNEQRHPLYMTQRQHTHPHIMENAFHFGKDRHIPDQKKGQYQYSQHTDDSNIEMPEVKTCAKTVVSVPVSLKKYRTLLPAL